VSEAKVLTTFDEGNIITYKPMGIRLRRFLLPILLMAVDYSAILAAVWTAYFFRSDILPLFIQLPYSFDVSRPYLFFIIPFAFIFFIHYDHLYTRRLLFWQQTEKLFKVSIYAMLIVLVLMYINHTAGEISRVFLVSVWLISFIYLIISQYFAKKVLTASGFWKIPVVIIGAGKTAELLLSSLEADCGLGYKIVGLVEDKQVALRKRYPVIGTFDQAEKAVARTGVKDVLIAVPGLNREDLLNMIYRLQPHVDNITFVPDLFGVPVGDMELDTLFNEKTVLLRIRNNLTNVNNRVLKHSFDIICSLLGLVVILPLTAIITLCIYLDSPGPVIFAHNRIGRGGEVFPCYKFRSMVTDAQAILEEHLKNNPEAGEEWDRDFKLKSDPRITKVGAFLRRTSLDELPQLFNVLRGEMSLVGPRPIVAEEVAKYGKYITDYYLVRPGITGMWQTSGRNDIDYNERVQLDSWYVRNWSLWQDIALLVKTVKVVLKGRGAY